MSLSEGDRRRQERLGAGAHLLRCATCGPLSEPLLARRRGLAGLLPAPVAAWVGGAAGGPSRRQQFTGVAAAAAAAVLALGVWVWAQSGDGNDERPGQIASAAEGNRPAGRTSSAGPLVFGPAAAPVAPPRLIEAARADRPVRVSGAKVVAVPAAEGLWIEARGERAWVQLRAPGESPVQVRRGMRLDVQANPVQHGAGFARRVGLDDGAAARRLDRAGVHLQADPGDLTIR